MSDIAKEFWSLVCVGDIRDCWEWTGSIDRRGYGVVTAKFQLAFRDAFAHRIACLITRDNPLNLPSVLHGCDNPACCNPRHLRWGTPADNSEDQRIATWARDLAAGHAYELVGGVREENIPSVLRQRLTRLTPELVRNIRRDFEAGMSVKDIATKYVLTHSHADSVAKRRIWKHVA